MKRYETYSRRGLLTKFNFIKKERNGGSYDKKRDFFTVHWEIKHDEGDNVRLHVESPTKAVDPTLNDLKQRVVHGLLFIGVIGLPGHMGYTVEPGRFVGTKNTNKNIQNMQSTEVFRVNLKPDQMTGSIRDRIMAIDNDFGLHIQDILWEFVGEILELF